MLIRTLRHLVKRSTFSPIFGRYNSTKVSKPLRILFCGSDEFSCASLIALHAEQQRDPERIASIDVLCRPGKRAGRGLKVVRQVPLQRAAEALGLPIYERNTFTGWDLPKPSDENINLIVAVSFGLFVPPRILKSAEYGGLNVHPSLLPNFRGPAPLQHTILHDSKVTGVTLQTLDEIDFDHGTILAQTPQSQLLHIDSTTTYEDLLERITPIAANMLIQGIRDKVYIRPYEEKGWYKTSDLHRAPKITSADREIAWKTTSGKQISQAARALGRLWNNVGIDPYTTRRMIFEDVEFVPLPDAIKSWYRYIEANSPKGNYHAGIEAVRLKQKIRFLNIKLEQAEDWAQLFVLDGDAVIFPVLPAHHQTAIRVKEITVDGSRKQSARQALAGLDEDADWILRRGTKFSFRCTSKRGRVRKVKVKAYVVKDDGPKVRIVTAQRTSLGEQLRMERAMVQIATVRGMHENGPKIRRVKISAEPDEPLTGRAITKLENKFKKRVRKFEEVVMGSKVQEFEEFAKVMEKDEMESGEKNVL